STPLATSWARSRSADRRCACPNHSARYGSTCWSATPSRSPAQSAAAFRAERAKEPLRHRLHTSGEEVPGMAAVVPVQFPTPPLVQLESGLAQRHPVVPSADDEATLRRRRRLGSQQID